MKYIAFAAAFILIIIDRVTKYFAFLNLPGKQIPVIDDVLYLVYTTNNGAAFSSFSGQRGFLILITSVFVFLITAAVLTNRVKNRFLIWALMFIVAGGAGNLVDRIQTGEVPDFIYFKIINFPIFNFADICAVGGTIMLVLYVIFGEIHSRKARGLASAEFLGDMTADDTKTAEIAKMETAETETAKAVTNEP